MARGTLALVVLALVIVACGAPASAPIDPSAGAACDAADLPACERAMLGAGADKMPALVAAYARAKGDARWLTLWQAMSVSDARALWIGKEPPPDWRHHALPSAPTSVPLEALLVALGERAGVRHLFVAAGSQLTQMFPGDALGPLLAALPPVLAATRAHAARDADLAAALDAAIGAAQRFDYVAAATHAERLRALLIGRARDDEAAMRARHGLAALDAAGITLAIDDDAREPTDEPPPFGDNKSAYADLLAVVLSRPDTPSAWAARRARITGAVSTPQARMLDALYGEREACRALGVPPMAGRGDLTFAGALADALDGKAAPGSSSATPRTDGKLDVDAWLPRYERMVALIDEHQLTWSLIGAMLSQRGELHGLSASATASYKRVSELAQKHVAALGALAQAFPARFQTLGVVSLVYLRGALGDPPLREALTQLVERSVALKIDAAADVSALYEATMAAFAVGMSYPAPLQGPHFGALRQGLATKLQGVFGRRGGWGVAGLHIGSAALGMLMGHGDALGAATEPTIAALEVPGIEHPGLARLLISAARYAELGAAGDATVSNPAMFSAARASARAALRDAVAILEPGGPQAPPERELLDRTVDLADGLIVAIIAELGDGDDAPTCSGQSAVSASLRDAFDRLQRKRRALLDHPAFSTTREVSPWLARARLLGLVMSDALDVADQRSGELRLSIDDARAQAVVTHALDGWTDGRWSTVISRGYLLARGAFGAEADQRHFVDNATAVLGALAALFGSEGSSLFTSLASAGGDIDAQGDMSTTLVRHAQRAYAAAHGDEGDLLLMIALAVAIVREEAVAEAAIALALERERPIVLPLTMYGKRARAGGDPAELAAAIRRAVAGECDAPDPSAVIAVKGAVYDFRRGERRQALAALERMLDDADARGLLVPRQIFRYELHSGDKVFNAEQSLSFGADLLKGSGTFQVGLGMQTKRADGASMSVRFASGDDAGAWSESARYYAHAAALAATYQLASGDVDEAVGFARRAVGVWTNGAKLGDVRVPTGGDSASWVADAPAVLALAAQLAADAGQPFLAGDLWSLAKAGLERGADDDDIAALLDSLPLTLRQIPELEALSPRARRSLELVAAGLPCTKRPGDAAKFERVDCAAYPTALGLRIADAMPVLPRLKTGAERGKPGCEGWRALDSFLAAADAGRYEPDAFNAAVNALLQRQNHDGAATLIARHRHPRHCTPEINQHARALAARPALGVHLRADLLSVAANCASGAEVAADLAALDALTQLHPLPLRNFEVLLFGVQLALQSGDHRPLHGMTSKRGFIQRWSELGPDIQSAALLIHHAATIGVGEPIDQQSSLPHYRLLCTTFPAERRSARCNVIALLRATGASVDKKSTAKQALADFLQSATAPAP